MNYFRERFGFDEIRLASWEKEELHQKLKIQDQKRIEFFAFVSMIATIIFLVLDALDLYGSHQIVYLISDLALFFVSTVIALAAFIEEPKMVMSRIQHFMVSIYPIVCIIWATVIATMNPASMLNMFTFYIAFFLISFFLSPSLPFYISYFCAYIATYIIVSLILEAPLLSETFMLLLIGSIITIPFYSNFRSTRKNSLIALLKLDKSNQSLGNELVHKIQELNLANEDLNNEITRRKIIENKLRDALKKAELSDQLKSEFLANISHEIRTPLNAIIGFTEMLTEDGVNAEQKKEFQKLVSSNTMFLLSTIDDIFDASLVSNHQINSINTPFKINKFLEALFYESTGIALKYSTNNIQFKPVKLFKDEAELISDEYYLKKALLRLIDNAYKFTPQGTVEVGARSISGKIQFYVKDTGISICEEDKQKIFQPFVQGDGSFTRDYGGVGLGLSIVKGIADELKCELNMESEKGKGSVFTLTFNK